MRVISCRPSDDQFWIGCNKEEAIKIFLPLTAKAEKDNYYKIYRDHNIGEEWYWDMVREVMKFEGTYHAFFNISRDLSLCFPHFPHFPFANLWNAYSPFRKFDQVEISSLVELKDIKMTYQGEEYGKDIPID